MLLSGSLDVLCSGPASRLLTQSQIFKSLCFLGTHQCSCSFGWTQREISSAGLLLWEGLLQSHVNQYIQWDEAFLLPTEDSDEAVPFFLRGHTDLRARGEKRKDSVQQEEVGTHSRSCC